MAYVQQIKKVQEDSDARNFPVFSYQNTYCNLNNNFG